MLGVVKTRVADREPAQYFHSIGTKPRSSSWTWIVLVGAVVIAALLRLPFLDSHGLWGEEVFSVEVAGAHSLSGLWNQISGSESTPPLYYLLAWLVDGTGVVGMRMISALSLTAAVPVSFFAVRSFIGHKAGLATALMVAVNPMLLSYSTFARSYGLFVLTALLAVWGFSAVLQESSLRRNWVLWALAAVACVWTHYFGIFLVGGEIVLLFFLRPRARLPLIWFGIAVAVCLAPLVPLISSQIGSRTDFIAEMSFGGRVTGAFREFAMGPYVPRSWLELAGLLVFYSGVVGGIAMALRSRGSRLTLAALVGFVLLVPLVGSLFFHDRFLGRNVIIVAPLLAAVAAPALLRLRAIPLAVYLALATATSLWVATDWRYQLQIDWTSALTEMTKVDRNAAVVAVARYGAPPVRAFLGKSPSSDLKATSAWVVVPPRRASGQRALSAASSSPMLQGFTKKQALLVDGFRLTLFTAKQPTSLRQKTVTPEAIFSRSN
jgi:4-amino-4-deoxy-L-arabinose transferase-like glycosyltransferase